MMELDFRVLADGLQQIIKKVEANDIFSFKVDKDDRSMIWVYDNQPITDAKASSAFTLFE